MIARPLAPTAPDVLDALTLPMIAADLIAQLDALLAAYTYLPVDHELLTARDGLRLAADADGVRFACAVIREAVGYGD